MSNPFTLKELYDFSTSGFDTTYIKTGGNQTNKSIAQNSNSNLRTGIYATYKAKVEVISLSSDGNFIEFGLGGSDVEKFDAEYIKEFGIKRLFTLYKPINNEPTGIYFEKVVIWDNYQTIKSTYVLKDGKWYRQ